MKRSVRLALFLASVAGFAFLYLDGVLRLPPAGSYRGPYGDVLNAVAVAERHATDVVTAINFDYRGFDTLGEEFILFTSVTGVALLLRRHRDEIQEPEGEREEHDRARDRHPPPESDATRLMGLTLIGLGLVFGFYVVTHGALTPGGGFQGGVVLATMALIVYLAGEARIFHRVAPHGMVEASEAAGAGGFVVVGLAALAMGAPFLANIVPLGPAEGSVDSGGTIAIISFVVGVEVAGGFVLLLDTFLQETLELARRRGGRR